MGTDCFNSDDSSEEKPQGRFCLKDCERLTRVNIGGNSFTHFAVCEIECLDSLEVIEIGDRTIGSFVYTSELKVKSECGMMNRHAQVEVLYCWWLDIL